MKKNIKIFLLISVLIIVAIIVFFAFRNNESNYSEIKITFSDLSVSTEEKNVTITDKDTVKKITDICKKLDSAKNDNVSTSIIHNYVISFENGTKIYMDSTIPNYGYVNYNNSEISEFIKLPEGFFNYIKELVQAY